MSKCILNVEDQEDNLRILRDLPTAKGFNTVDALTGSA